jgi:hypothetical protein
MVPRAGRDLSNDDRDLGRYGAWRARGLVDERYPTDRVARDPRPTASRDSTREGPHDLGWSGDPTAALAELIKNGGRRYTAAAPSQSCCARCAVPVAPNAVLALKAAISAMPAQEVVPRPFFASNRQGHRAIGPRPMTMVWPPGACVGPDANAARPHRRQQHTQHPRAHHVHSTSQGSSNRNPPEGAGVSPPRLRLRRHRRVDHSCRVDDFRNALRIAPVFRHPHGASRPSPRSAGLWSTAKSREHAMGWRRAVMTAGSGTPPPGCRRRRLRTLHGFSSGEPASSLK